MKKTKTLYWLNNITFISNIDDFFKVPTEKTGIKYMAFYLPESAFRNIIKDYYKP